MKTMKKTSMDAYCAIQSLFVPASFRQSVPLSTPVRHDPPPLFVSFQTEEKGAGANDAGAEQSRAEQSRAEQSRASNPLLRKSFPASCDEHVSYLDPARNQFPYASCADFSGSGRRSFWSLPLRWGRFAPRRTRLCEFDRPRTRDAKSSVFKQGERGTRTAAGGIPFFEPGGAGHFSDFELKST